MPVPCGRGLALPLAPHPTPPPTHTTTTTTHTNTCQSYVLATDRRGLDVWLADGNVFACWDSMWDVIWHGELGRRGSRGQLVGRLPTALPVAGRHQSSPRAALALAPSLCPALQLSGHPECWLQPGLLHDALPGGRGPCWVAQQRRDRLQAQPEHRLPAAVHDAALITTREWTGVTLPIGAATASESCASGLRPGLPAVGMPL